MFVAFVMPCALGRPACLASPAYAGLTSQLVLARARGHVTLAGGSCVAAALLFVRPLSALAPPATPVRQRGGALTHSFIFDSIVHLI
jgi:hypothetical protein